MRLSLSFSMRFFTEEAPEFELESRELVSDSPDDGACMAAPSGFAGETAAGAAAGGVAGAIFGLGGFAGGGVVVVGGAG